MVMLSNTHVICVVHGLINEKCKPIHSESILGNFEKSLNAFHGCDKVLDIEPQISMAFLFDSMILVA